MTIGLAHLEITAAVADELVSESLTGLANLFHIADVEAEMDESRVAPESAFIQLASRWNSFSFNSLDKLDM